MLKDDVVYPLEKRTNSKGVEMFRTKYKGVMGWAPTEGEEKSTFGPIGPFLSKVEDETDEMRAAKKKALDEEAKKAEAEAKRAANVQMLAELAKVASLEFCGHVEKLLDDWSNEVEEVKRSRGIAPCASSPSSPASVRSASAGNEAAHGLMRSSVPRLWSSSISS